MDYFDTGSGYLKKCTCDNPKPKLIGNGLFCQVCHRIMGVMTKR